MLYKVINDTTVLDVLDTLIYVRYQGKNGVLAVCPESKANGILSSDSIVVWHLDTLPEFPVDGYETVSIVEIDEEEYNALKDALDKNKEQDVDIPVEDNYIPNMITLDFLKSSKTSEMSEVCNKTIIGGFDVELSDNKTYHFDMTLEDQLNISSLETQIRFGADQVPYHASGELCRMYSAEDISKVVEVAMNFKTYHITYFNSLKNYINSMGSKEQVRDVYYGIEIPMEYQSNVLKMLLNS